MGLFGKPEVAELQAERDFRGLAEIFKKRDDELRGQALRALEELRDPACVVPLLEIIYRLRTRTEAFREVRALFDRLGPAIVPALVSEIDSNGEEAGPAMSELARLGEDHALEPITQLTRHEVPRIRQRAYEGLLELDTPASLELVAEVVESRDADAVVELWSYDGLSPRLIRALLSVFRDGSDAELIERADKAVNKFAERMSEHDGPIDDAIAVIVEYIEDPEGLARYTAVRWLVQLAPGDENVPASPDRRLAEPLSRVLGDPDESVRAMAANGLARCGDRRALPVLHELLVSPNGNVRNLAAGGAGALRDETALERLEQMVAMSSGDPDVDARKAAARAARLIKEHRRKA